MKRPSHIKAPKHLSASPPVPKPASVEEQQPPADGGTRLDPTRYGDWEKGGVAVDF
jgi:hypothetical protein